MIMTSLIQHFKESTASFLSRFSPKKDSGGILAAVFFAALMTIVDTFLLFTDNSFFHIISVAITSVLKIGIATIFGGILASLVPIQTKERSSAVQAVPADIFSKASRFLWSSNIVVFAATAFVGNIIELDRSEDIVRRFLGNSMALLVVSVITRQIQWLYGLLSIRRTEMTDRFRLWFVVVAVLVVLMEIFAAIFGFTTQTVQIWLFMLIGPFFFISIWRLPWLATFSKDQKWKALGLSALTLTLSLAIFIYSSENPEILKTFNLLLPGLANIMQLTGILSAIFFFRVSFSIMLALPTATVMDRKIQEVKSLAYLSSTISQVYDLQRLLQIVTTMIRDVCGATSSWIELYDDTTGYPRITAQLKITQEQLQMLYKDGVLRSFLAAHNEINTQAIHFEALDEEQAFASVYPYTADFVQSLIAVPLMLDNKRIGTIFAAHKEKFAFEFEDISLLSAFANNISIAIENARLFENSLEKERFKRELLLAREMQQKLLPKELPHVHSFDIAAYSAPALEVGGDYYDSVQLKDGTHCLIIGDVSGKGITAAFYMAELKGVALAVARESASPKDLLQRLNAALLGNMEKGTYITVTAVALDEIRRELIIARAGHTPIALYRTSEGDSSVELLTPKGFGVSLVSPAIFDSSLEEIRIPCVAGDRCLIFTDGINESTNNHNDEFGYEPLCDILRDFQLAEAQYLVGEVVRCVVDFSNGTAQHDDMTVIGILAQ